MVRLPAIAEEEESWLGGRDCVGAAPLYAAAGRGAAPRTRAVATAFGFVSSGRTTCCSVRWRTFSVRRRSMARTAWRKVSVDPRSSGEHGRPVGFYSDKHAICRVNSEDAVGGGGVLRGEEIRQFATGANVARFPGKGRGLHLGGTSDGECGSRRSPRNKSRGLKAHGAAARSWFHPLWVVNDNKRRIA